jgi:hypothetical protein
VPLANAITTISKVLGDRDASEVQIGAAVRPIAGRRFGVPRLAERSRQRSRAGT